jgi:hypothetical protein
MKKGGYMMSGNKLKKLCQESARILSGSGSLDENRVCLVQKFRDIDFTILGSKTNSPLVNPQF